MADTWFVLITVALGVVLGAALIALIGSLAIGLDHRLDQRRARQRRRLTQLDGGEPPDALEAFGVDISVWPSRAPRNGQSHEEEAST